MSKKNKKGMEAETLIWWIIAIAVLIFLVVAVLIFRGKGEAAINFIKDIFMFKGR